VGGFLLLFAVLAAVPAVSADPRLAKLSPEHEVLARRMVDFMERADERFLSRAAALNKRQPPFIDDALQRETDDSLYDVLVTRGPVVAKLGRMIVEGKKTQPGRREGELAWSRFYSIDVHAETPMVGMLHATLVLQFYLDGSAYAGGWLGIMNGTRVDGDMERIAELVDEHFGAAGRSPKVYRQLMVKGTEEVFTEFRRRPDPAGVSFYGPPVFPGDVARSYDFIETLFLRFTDAYLNLVDQRAGEPGNPADVLAKTQMEKRWLIDQLYSDPFASKLVPFEVWSLANVPPAIRF
jgi:hypothetical protein